MHFDGRTQRSWLAAKEQRMRLNVLFAGFELRNGVEVRGRRGILAVLPGAFQIRANISPTTAPDWIAK